MKKLSFLFAAFLLGLFVSITIHACGGDKDEMKAETPGGGTDNPSGGGGESPANCMWGVQKMAYIDYCDEAGELLNRTEYSYDSSGREIKWSSITYTKSTETGIRYRSSTQETTYTYTSDGRTNSAVFTGYDESGKVTYLNRNSGKEVLYKK